MSAENQANCVNANFGGDARDTTESLPVIFEVICRRYPVRSKGHTKGIT